MRDYPQAIDQGVIAATFIVPLVLASFGSRHSERRTVRLSMPPRQQSRADAKSRIHERSYITHRSMSAGITGSLVRSKTDLYPTAFALSSAEGSPSICSIEGNEGSGPSTRPSFARKTPFLTTTSSFPDPNDRDGLVFRQNWRHLAKLRSVSRTDYEPGSAIAAPLLVHFPSKIHQRKQYVFLTPAGCHRRLDDRVDDRLQLTPACG